MADQLELIPAPAPVYNEESCFPCLAAGVEVQALRGVSLEGRGIPGGGPETPICLDCQQHISDATRAFYAGEGLPGGRPDTLNLVFVADADGTRLRADWWVIVGRNYTGDAECLNGAALGHSNPFRPEVIRANQLEREEEARRRARGELEDEEDDDGE